MLHVLLSLGFSLAIALAAHSALRKLFVSLDPAEGFGLAGLIGLGVVGTVVYWVGLVNLPAALVVGGLLTLVGLGKFFVERQWPNCKLDRAAIFLLPAILFSIAHCMAPLGEIDWDALAYHLAVPKIWWKAGHIVEIPYIHHSYFPFALDSLNLFGAAFGSELFQKTLSYAPIVFGYFAVFGYLRRTSNAVTAWWGLVAFAYVPLVLWQAGSAYVDVAHGLYAGFALLYLINRLIGKASAPDVVIGLLLGLACGTKYTGWQTVVVCGVLWAVAMVKFADRRREFVRLAAVAMSLTFLLGGAYLARNVAATGNPVYPFLFERFGGKYWNQWRADLYRNEQQSFGVGRTETGRDWSQFAHATLGLAYQTGRYINPGQTEGRGLPTGAIGPIVILVMLFAPWLRPRKAETGWILSAAGLSLAMWFVLSQQSRYCLLLLPLSLPLLAQWLDSAKVERSLARGAVIMCTLNSVLLYGIIVVPEQLQNQQLFGGYTRQGLRQLSGLVGNGRVALFDQVFGFDLDCDYIWANPGHSTLVPSENLSSGSELIQTLKAQRVDYVLVTLKYMPRDRAEWFESPNSQRPDWYEEAFNDPQTRWQALLVDGLMRQLLVPASNFSGSVLWKIAP